MTKLVFDETPDLDVQDGGRARILEVGGPKGVGGDGVFVRFQSWDDNKAHGQMKPFEGKKLRVTIEVID